MRKPMRPVLTGTAGRRSSRALVGVGAMALVVALAGCDLASVSSVSGDVVATPTAPISYSGGDISDDGEVVVFSSTWAYDAADTNGVRDVIVSNRNTGFQVRVSTAIGGGAPNASSSSPSVSGDGRFVAWHSASSDIVPGDSNGASDVFRLDTVAGVTERVSVSSAGIEASGSSSQSSISSDGRFVAFGSSASDLVPNDTNAQPDVFVRDMDLGTTTRWSLDATGAEGSRSSANPDISGDGTSVAFSTGSALDPADTNGLLDVYLKDERGSILWISRPASGRPADGPSIKPAVNEDGTVVAFNSDSSSFDERDHNGDFDIYVWEGGAIELVSVTPDGEVGSGRTTTPSVDSSGNLVAFGSDSPELTDRAPSHQALVRNRQEGHSDLVSTSSTGEVGNGYDNLEAISGDGRSVLVLAQSNNLLPDDPNPGLDMVVKAYPFPRITSVTPSVLLPGTTTTVTIEGKGFSGPVYVSFSPNPAAAVTTGGTRSVSPNLVRVNVTVPPGAAVHTHDLKVWNLGDHPDNSGAETTCYDCVQVG